MDRSRIRFGRWKYLQYSQVALKSDSDLAELGGKGYVKFDLSAREFDLCAR